MVSGIIICHAELARALLDAAETILGPAESVYTFSNSDLATRQLVAEISLLVENTPVSEVVIMVDLKGGSCWTVGRMLQRNHPDFRLVTGVNLPMVTSFLTKRQRLSLDELAEAMADDGHRGIVFDRH